MSSAAWPPAPPTDENDHDKATRLAAEREAKKISDDIDRALETERQELRKRKPQTKVLLLGQAESGKSTLIKNFQIFLCPNTFHAEIEAWRTVIHLNLARFVNYVLHVLFTTSPTSGKPDSTLRVLQMRLSPLKQVEIILSRALSVDTASTPTSPVAAKPTWRANPAPEVSIRGGSGWKNLMKRRRGSQARPPTTMNELDDARRIMDACKDDMVALWKSHGVGALEEEGVDLHHHARYFLDHAARVADMKYIPTTEDVLRARLRTLGVEEYRFTLENGVERGTDWIFYDVGGSRNQRAAWASYFDDVNAVIFLCPVSGFNQWLSEDSTVNRLHDSIELWEKICKSKLLANATFILLLNKADLLHAKLKSGITFSDYVTCYKGVNKVEHVVQFLREQLVITHRMCSPKKRQLHTHVTCAIDTKVMAAVLASVQDCIMLSMLQNTTLL